MTAPAPWEKYISLANVFALYREGIRRYGGDHSDPKPGCVERSLAAAWNAESYTDSECDHLPGLVLAGYLLVYLAMNHCFTDGNKRVAWSTAMSILLCHGLTVEATAEEAEKLMIEVIAGTIGDGLEVADWLAERLVAVEHIPS
jgi:death on curing protein